jgi:hypothetical protein
MPPPGGRHHARSLQPNGGAALIRSPAATQSTPSNARCGPTITPSSWAEQHLPQPAQHVRDTRRPVLRSGTGVVMITHLRRHR